MSVHTELSCVLSVMVLSCTLPGCSTQFPLICTAACPKDAVFPGSFIAQGGNQVSTHLTGKNQFFENNVSPGRKYNHYLLKEESDKQLISQDFVLLFFFPYCPVTHHSP